MLEQMPAAGSTAATSAPHSISAAPEECKSELQCSRKQQGHGHFMPSKSTAQACRGLAQVLPMTTFPQNHLCGSEHSYEPQSSASTHPATMHCWTGPTASTVTAQRGGTAETAALRDVLIRDLRFTEGLTVAGEGTGAVAEQRWAQAGTACSSSCLQTTEGVHPSLHPC